MSLGREKSPHDPSIDMNDVPHILPWRLQERFYFGDTVLPLFESGIPLFKERIKTLHDASSISIAYPDEGAWKRFHSQFLDYPEVGQHQSVHGRDHRASCCHSGTGINAVCPGKQSSEHELEDCWSGHLPCFILLQISMMCNQFSSTCGMCME